MINLPTDPVKIRLFLKSLEWPNKYKNGKNNNHLAKNVHRVRKFEIKAKKNWPDRDLFFSTPRQLKSSCLDFFFTKCSSYNIIFTSCKN